MSEHYGHDDVLVLDEDEMFLEMIQALPVSQSKRPTKDLEAQDGPVKGIIPVLQEKDVPKAKRPASAKGPGSIKRPAGPKKGATAVTAIFKEEDLLKDGFEDAEEPQFTEEGEELVVHRLAKSRMEFSYDAEMAYKREVERHPVLPYEQQTEYLRRYVESKDQDAWDKLVLHNQRLVATFARYYSRIHSIPFMDLVQDGNFGLMHAIRRFSFAKECRLGTYAVWWIKQAITRAIMDRNRTIRLPVHVHDTLSKSRKASYRLLQRLGREPKPEEICAEAGITMKRLKAAEKGLKNVLSMDASMDGSDDGDPFGDFIADDRPSQEEAMHDRELSENVIGPALVRLNPQQRFVLVLRFGLDGFAFTEEEIVEATKFKREMVRELELSALRKLDPPGYIVFDRVAAIDWLRRKTPKGLTLQEELMFILRYGVGAQQNTLANIANYIGISRERIRQVEERALIRLKYYMRYGTLSAECKSGLSELNEAEEVVSAAQAMRGVY